MQLKNLPNIQKENTPIDAQEEIFRDGRLKFIVNIDFMQIP